MSDDASSFAPLMLISMPQLADPNFERTVVLLCAYGPEGAFGLVVNRMLEWYREGINPQPRLMYLATYLGHKDINSTLVYLTITQELLQQASERFRTLAAHSLHAEQGGLQ